MNRVTCYVIVLLCLLPGKTLFAQSAVTLHFNNTVGNNLIQLNSETYTNAAGEPFSINILQYFISNIQFTTIDGKPYTVPQDKSYFLVQQDDSISQYCTVQLPPGQYSSVSFIIGIDSLRSVSKIDKRKGVLDPSATDMYWGWNSGYIFLKIEGASAAAPEDAAGLHKFRYHIGGFGGYQSKTINNIKTIHLPLLNGLSVINDHPATIELQADILKLFNATTPLRIAEHNAVMFDTFSTVIAENYASMFSVEQVKN